ncbi:hypothetical protein YPPY14_1762, partial [Yersinia pestis PY-14]
MFLFDKFVDNHDGIFQYYDQLN